MWYRRGSRPLHQVASHHDKTVWITWSKGMWLRSTPPVGHWKAWLLEKKWSAVSKAHNSLQITAIKLNCTWNMCPIRQQDSKRIENCCAVMNSVTVALSPQHSTAHWPSQPFPRGKMTPEWLGSSHSYCTNSLLIWTNFTVRAINTFQIIHDTIYRIATEPAEIMN